MRDSNTYHLLAAIATQAISGARSISTQNRAVLAAETGLDHVFFGPVEQLSNPLESFARILDVVVFGLAEELLSGDAARQREALKALNGMGHAPLYLVASLVSLRGDPNQIVAARARELTDRIGEAGAKALAQILNKTMFPGLFEVAEGMGDGLIERLAGAAQPTEILGLCEGHRLT